MIHVARWLCPYCGRENKRRFALSAPHTEIVYCDVEEGGCDRRVVLDTTISVTFKARGIDGEREAA